MPSKKTDESKKIKGQVEKIETERIPILNLSPAEIAYFEQTRKECDTEKSQKDRALQYAFLVTGGTSVFGLTNLESSSAESSWLALLLSFSLLIIVIALMGWRRQKLRAQGYRWVVLYDLIKSGTKENSNWISLELIIIRGIKKNIHGRDDRLFIFGLSLPILSIILWHSYKLSLVYFQYPALIVTVISFIIFIWSLIRHSRPTFNEFGIGEIINQIEKI